MVRKPWAWAAGACSRGFASAGRRGTGTRTVSAEGAGSWELGAGSPEPSLLPAPCSLLPLSAKYPPTPAATTASPITAGGRERRRAAGRGGVGPPRYAGGRWAGAAIHGSAHPLLGRHVVRRADDHPGRRQSCRGLERLGDPEVREHHPAVVVEHDVGRLHVAVHHTALMGVSQGAGRFPENPLDLRHGKRLLLVEQILERGARDVLHDEVVEPALALDAIDGNDVGVIELGRGLGLLLEAAHHLVVLSDVGRQHLDRDLALERQIMRQEDLAHPSLTQQALEPVLALDDALQPLAHDVDAAGAGESVPARYVRTARQAESAVAGNRRVAAEALDDRARHRSILPRWSGIAASTRARRVAAAWRSDDEGAGSAGGGTQLPAPKQRE